MGNHEYCEDCEASDFHHGRPCDPKRLAEAQERRRLANERDKRLTEKARKLAEALTAKGIPAQLNQYGYVEVVKWDLENVEINL